jgi:hypothetical protein
MLKTKAGDVIGTPGPADTFLSSSQVQQRKQADQLVDIAKAAHLFHAPDSTCYADITVAGCRHTLLVRSKGFKRWLSKEFFTSTNSAPNSEAMQSALNVIEAMAAYDGEERRVYVRVGGTEDTIYILTLVIVAGAQSRSTPRAGASSTRRR